MPGTMKDAGHCVTIVATTAISTSANTTSITAHPPWGQMPLTYQYKAG